VDYRITASKHVGEDHSDIQYARSTCQFRPPSGGPSWVHTADSNTLPCTPISLYRGLRESRSQGSLQSSRRGCTDYTRAPSVPGRARLCLRVVEQAIHTAALKGVRAGPGSRAQGQSSLPSPITNAVISCIRCECDCRMLRILAVHSTHDPMDDPMEGVYPPRLIRSKKSLKKPTN